MDKDQFDALDAQYPGLFQGIGGQRRIPEIEPGWVGIIARLSASIYPLSRDMPEVCADCHRPVGTEHPVIHVEEGCKIGIAGGPLHTWGPQKGDVICRKYVAGKPGFSLIKQKFRALQVHTNGALGRSERAKELIRAAVEEADRTCEHCGKEGGPANRRGWMCVLCPECKFIEDSWDVKVRE